MVTSGQMTSHQRPKNPFGFFGLSGFLFRKDGQMKIQQMAFMLIAVMVFFALVGLVIISVKFSGLKDQATELKEREAILLVTNIANSPEFSCGSAFGEGKVSCIDFAKIIALKRSEEHTSELQSH